MRWWRKIPIDRLQAAAGLLRLCAGVMERSAMAGPQLLIALDMHLSPTL
ncbi:MAG: hypothetical protein ABGZ53_02620 [Fuerstiella sp.]